MTASIGLTKPGKGSGKVVSMFYDREYETFRVVVMHTVGLHTAVTPVELKPNELAVTIFSHLIPGWLSESEMKCLFNFSQSVNKPIVEIGSFMGRSTICLGWGSKLGRGVRVFAVDPHRGSVEHQEYLKSSIGTYPTFVNNMTRAGLEELVIPVRDKSDAVARRFENESLGLVYIDGDHDLADHDFDLWFPKLIAGGYILMHDSAGPLAWPAVQEAARTRILESDVCEFVTEVDSITVGRKRCE